MVLKHKRTKVSRPQTNGIVERLHRTVLDEQFRVEGRRTWFETVEEMQVSLDQYLEGHNILRPHQDRDMNDRTSLKALTGGLPNQKEKTRTPGTKTKPQSKASA